MDWDPAASRQLVAVLLRPCTDRGRVSPSSRSAGTSTALTTSSSAAGVLNELREHTAKAVGVSMREIDLVVNSVETERHGANVLRSCAVEVVNQLNDL
jgi:hypothetical protein